MESASRRPAVFWIIVPLAFVLGAFLRFEAAQRDLWLDEIYSITLVQPLQSALQVFSIAIDNNHYLNSLYLFCLGTEATPFDYRLPAFIFSLLTLALAVSWCARKGVLEGLLGAFVFSCSYILVLYGSEARGYSSLLCFALLCCALAKRYREDPRLVIAVCFWLSALLGVLSHFSFLHFYAALLLSSFIGAGRSSLKDLVTLHAIPVLFCGALALRFMGLFIAGGPQGSRLEVLVNSLTVPYGGAELSISNLDGGVLLLALAALVFLILCAEIFQQISSKKADAWFYFILVVGGPIVLLLVLRPEVFVVRYVLLSIFFGYFVFVDFLARLLRRDFAGRVLAGALLGLFLLGNANLLDKLFRYGRGQYSQALAFIARNSPQDRIIIGSDHDFRNSLLVEHYAARAPLGKTFSYVNGQYPKPSEATWIITHSQDQSEIPAPELPESGLTLAAVFNSAPLSGMRWFVYCREGQCPAVVSIR